MIKSFLTEDENEVQNLTESILEFEDDLASFIRLIRAKRLFLSYQNVANIIVFLQDDQFILSFVDSRRKKINDLLKKRVFELIIINKVLENIRIF